MAEYLGIEVDFSARGYDSIGELFDRLEAKATKLGKTNRGAAAEFTRFMSDAIASYRGNPEALQWLANFQRSLDRRFGAGFNRLLTGPNADRAFFGGRKTLPVDEKYISVLKQGGLAVGKFAAAFAVMKKSFASAEAVAKMTHELRMLTLTSDLGTQSMLALGNAASLFGGSYASVAQATTRYNTQMANARFGRGFGYLNDAVRFGFGFDPNESYEQRSDRAVSFLRGEKDIAMRTTMAQAIDPMNYKQLLGYAAMSADAYKEMKEYFRKTADQKDAFGDNRAKTAEANSAEYDMAKQRLSANWEQIKIQAMNALLPILTQIMKIGTWFAEVINRFPKLISAITACITALAVFRGALMAKNAVSFAARFMSLMKNIGSVKSVADITRIMSGGGSAARSGAGLVSLASRMVAGIQSGLLRLGSMLPFGVLRGTVLALKATGVGAAVAATAYVSYKLGEKLGNWIADQMSAKRHQQSMMDWRTGAWKGKALTSDINTLKQQLKDGPKGFYYEGLVKGGKSKEEASKMWRSHLEAQLSMLERQYNDYKGVASQTEKSRRDGAAGASVANVSNNRSTDSHNTTNNTYHVYGQEGAEAVRKGMSGDVNLNEKVNGSSVAA